MAMGFEDMARGTSRAEYEMTATGPMAASYEA